MRRNRPPTRVNNACDRCRRQKQRCDDFRPCSNCLHARKECASAEQVATSKKPRLTKESEPQQVITDVQHHSTETDPIIHTNDAERDVSPGYRPSVPPIERPSQAHGLQQRSISNEWHGSRRDRSALQDLHGSDSAMEITKKILGYAGSPGSVSRETFAIPGGASNRAVDFTPTNESLMPISDIIGTDLPPREISDALVDTYFYAVHWFSLIVHESKFRTRYAAVMENGLASPSDRAFLLLLLMVMVMGCWYGPGILPAEVIEDFDLVHTRKAFLKVVSQAFMDLIDEDCLEFVQLSALLGTYWLYWGRPRSSFSILGAATKTAQSMELHRDPNKNLSYEDAEERKRVWWTIYTWDRFAAIIYGRPLGINDKDCNVSMPASFSEDVSFLPVNGCVRVSLSPYQIQLNRIYQIASPLLENIYGIRYSHNRALRSEMPGMVAKIDHLMQAWQDDLPPHLHLEQNDDVTVASSIEEKMHRLQALSLQLTYDNLMIVIHRPLLADQGYERSRARGASRSQPKDTTRGSISAQEGIGTNSNNFRQCLNSALRISKVQQSKRNLLALARSSHLVSFLGMNLFTSSVVLFICALSDTLSDTAQEAKRGLACNLKTLRLLSGDGSLSAQCSMILEDLVQQIVNREKEEMLCALPSDDEIAAFLPTRKNSYVDGHFGPLNDGTNLNFYSQTSNGQKQPLNGNSDENINRGGLAVHQAMASLQEVFKDNAIPRPAFNTSGDNGSGLYQRHFKFNQTPQLEMGDKRNENPGFTFDGSNFTTDDLGQFWLWNMDPYVDDGNTSWHSGDNHTQSNF